MKKAFYYKGQLVRKSDNHDYKYAVLRLDEDGAIISVLGCRADLDDAQSLLRSYVRRWRGERDFQLVELTEGAKK